MFKSLTHSVQIDGIVILCKKNDSNLPFATWGHDDVTLKNGKSANIGVLNVLLEDEKAIVIDNGDGVSIPHSSLAQLEGWEINGLGLPSAAPFRLAIETRGTLASDKFDFQYGFTDTQSFPVYCDKRNGAVMTCSEKEYIITDPLYSVIELLDKYKKNPIVDIDRRFLWWGEVRELLPEDTKLGKFLKTINIVKPENFTIDINEMDGDLQIIPRFVLPKADSSIENIEIGDNVEPINILPPFVNDQFNSTLLKHSSVKHRYALPNSWFVVLPDTVRASLEAVRRINKEPVPNKLKFIQNPKAEIRNLLEDKIQESILEQIFVETPLFLNERIKHLGVWQPKAGLYIKTEVGEWLPKDGPPPVVGIPMNGGIFNVATNELKELVSAMSYAMDQGLSETEYENTIYPVNKDSLDAVNRAINVIGEIKKPDKKDKDEGKTVRKEKYVPIIYDHIEELGIVVNEQKKRACVIDKDPELSEGIYLHEHQRFGLSWLRQHWVHASPGALLADDMGLGKTAQTLSFMNWVRLQMNNGCIPVRPFLLVAPTALLKNWEDEYVKFLPRSALGTIFKAHGSFFRNILNNGLATASERMKSSGWVLTTYETMRDKIIAFTGIHWAVTIFDEAQKIKNPKAMVTDMAKSIKAEFTIALTGTPVENSLADLWCIIDGVQPGRLETLKDFAKRYLKSGKATNDDLIKLKGEISKPIKYPLMLRRSKDENWIEKPEKNEIAHKNEMPSEQAMVYSAAVERSKNASGKKGAMLEALQSLRSVSLHPFINDPPEDHDAYINQSARMISTFKILDEINMKNEKVLIFVEYLHIQSAISEIIERRYKCNKVMIINGKVSGVKRQKRVDQFQNSSNGFDVMILSPKAGGVGLNLTAATHVIHLSRWWNPAVEDQCSDRAYRIGQTKNVTIHYPIAIHPEYGEEQSFDTILHNLLGKKRHLSRTLLAPPAGSKDDASMLYEEAIGKTANRMHKDKYDEKREDGINILNKIDLMEPIEFEQWVLKQFKNKGYEILSTPITGDAGCDGIAIAPSEDKLPSYVIQCKHTQKHSNLNHHAIEEILNSMNCYSDLPEGIRPMVVTNAKGFTQKGINLARNRNVQLIHRDKLAKL